MNTYFKMYHYSFLTILMYPYETLISIVHPLLEIGILALFWNMIAMSSNKQIDLNNIIAYFIIVQFIDAWSITPTGLRFGGQLGRLIKTGRLSEYLIRPMPVLPSYFFREKGYWMVDMIYSFFLLIIALTMISHLSLIRFAFFMLFMFFSFMISWSLCVLLGSMAFVVKEIKGIRHSVSHLVRLLSGALVPLTFFPEHIQSILKFTPFPYLVFSPINILQNETALNTVWLDLFISCVWSIILVWLAIILWHKGMRNYEATGI